ncbi:MAG: hypothetical protein ACLQDV_29840 [Candidatus Binataceae bacterium]
MADDRPQHFMVPYCDGALEVLHHLLGPASFFRQEVIEVPGLLTALFITYDGTCDDEREFRELSWEDFKARLLTIKPGWQTLERPTIEKLALSPEKLISGWEGRTLYFIRGGTYPGMWTRRRAEIEVAAGIAISRAAAGSLIEQEVRRIRETIPAGREHFREYERQVRVVFNFLFHRDLGEAQSQVRTYPEDEGVEIRDLLLANRAESGFWKELKDKYRASEIVVDCKNTDSLTREDLRQLYCYLKPVLELWGFIVCRSEPSHAIRAFNRTLCKNFSQERGALFICDDDLRRMVEIANRGHDPTEYIRKKYSEFIRSV